MKLLKSLALGLLASTTLSGVAFAQAANYSTVRIIGSSAFRPGATAAIVDVLGTGGKTVYAGYTGSSLLGSGTAIIANGTIGAGGTASIVVETYWTGSLAGVVDVIARNAGSSTYLDPSNFTSAQATDVNNSPTSAPYQAGYGFGNTVNGTANDAAPAFQSFAPDAAFSDSQASTIATELQNATLTTPISGTDYQGNTITYSTISSLTTAINNSTTTADSGTSTNGGALKSGHQGHHVGIVPFIWATVNAPTGVTNVSQQAAFNLIGKGSVPESFLDATSTASPSNYFFLVGRNEDSGTRIDAFSESKYGVTANPVQWQVDSSTQLEEYPPTALNTEPAITWNLKGHSGYVSGGKLATAISTSLGTVTFANTADQPAGFGATSTAYLLGYIGLFDAYNTVLSNASTGTTHSGRALTYAGEPYSLTDVEGGNYTFWSYEHMYHYGAASGGLTGTPLTTVNAIADTVAKADADIDGFTGLHDETVIANSGSAYTAAQVSAANSQASGILDDGNMSVYRTSEGSPLSTF